MSSASSIPDTPRDLTLSLTSIYDPVVHNMLKPVLLRAIVGVDWDCSELLLLITSAGSHPAIADPPCDGCQASGTPCIVTTKVVDAWSAPVVFAVSRCINCTLTNKVCPLIAQTHISVCTCDWLIPPADRHWISKHVQLSLQAAWEKCKPRAMRSSHPDQALGPHLRKWIANKLHVTSVEQSLSPNDQEFIRQLLGREVYREDGRWIRPPKEQWRTCVCAPGRCVPLRHQLDDDTISAMSECPTLSSVTQNAESECGVDDKFDKLSADEVVPELLPVYDLFMIEEGRCCGH